MILGNINNVGSEIKLLPEAIQKAINYLKETDFSTLENKKYSLQGDKIFILVNEYKTKPKQENKAEVHKKYIDVQFIISGKEIIGVGYENRDNELFKDYAAEKDASLYKELKNEIDITVYSGIYIIFFPEDIHRPGCNFKEESTVRKAVVKVSVDLI